MMNAEEKDLQELIENFREEFKKLPFEEVSKPSGVNGIMDYSDKVTLYKKGTPIHVKGSIIYNHLLDKNDLGNLFMRVEEGEKIRFCYLKLPNPAQSTVISCPGVLPRQFGLDKYIDYDTQFEKTFLDPVSKIAELMGWQAVYRPTLAGLWS